MEKKELWYADVLKGSRLRDCAFTYRLRHGITLLLTGASGKSVRLWPDINLIQPDASDRGMLGHVVSEGMEVISY